MWSRDTVGMLRHLQGETIGAARLWLGTARVTSHQIGTATNIDPTISRLYEHGPELRLV